MAAAWNALFFLGGLWFPLWWLGLFGDFVLAVLIAERVGRVVPLGAAGPTSARSPSAFRCSPWWRGSSSSTPAS